MLKRGLRVQRVSGSLWREKEGGDARDDSALVDASVELDDNLVRAVVVNLLELLDVACPTRQSARKAEEGRRGWRRTVLLHDGEEADDDLGARADEHLALATLLGVDNVVEAVGLHAREHGQLPTGLPGDEGRRTHEDGDTHG